MTFYVYISKKKNGDSSDRSAIRQMIERLCLKLKFVHSFRKLPASIEEGNSMETSIARMGSSWKLSLGKTTILVYRRDKLH
jgi:hypothetical protein